MTRRTARRHRTPHLATTALALAAVLVLLVVAEVAAHLAGLALAALIFGAGYWLGLRRRPVAKASISKPDSQAAMLNKEVARLQQELEREHERTGQAEASAQAAWDAASSVPPKPRKEPGIAKDRLLADPLGGVHELGGPR